MYVCVCIYIYIYQSVLSNSGAQTTQMSQKAPSFLGCQRFGHLLPREGEKKKWGKEEGRGEKEGKGGGGEHRSDGPSCFWSVVVRRTLGSKVGDVMKVMSK
jgi:hypothetical protein